MSGSLIDTSQRFEKSPTTTVSCLSDLSEGAKDQIIDFYVAGNNPRHIANVLHIDKNIIDKIIEQYLAEYKSLDQTDMLKLQTERISRVIAFLWKNVLDADVLRNPEYVKVLIDALDKLSELVGLKKQRIEQQVRVINETQVPIVVNYVTMVNNKVIEKIQPLLTPEGAKVLEKNYNTWLSEAATDSADIIEKPTLQIEM